MLRIATPDDAGVIARHRALMFHEMGVLPAEMIDVLSAATVECLPGMIQAGSYVGWLAHDPDTGSVIAGVGLQIRSVLPRPALRSPGVTRVVDRKGSS